MKELKLLMMITMKKIINQKFNNKEVEVKYL
jgi:hypothetical protein